MVTHEGGTIPEENLTNYNVDRVKTLGEAVLGLTLGCAQCHDHKYDPLRRRTTTSSSRISTRVSDIGLDGNGGKNPRPDADGSDGAASRRPRRASSSDLAKLASALARPDPQALAAWEDEQRAELAARGKDLALHPLEVLKVSTPNRGAGWDVEEQPRSSTSRRPATWWPTTFRCAAEDRFADHGPARRIPSRRGSARRRLGLWPGRRSGPAEEPRQRATADDGLQGQLRADCLLGQRRRRSRRPGQSAPAASGAARDGQFLAGRIPARGLPRPAQ